MGLSPDTYLWEHWKFNAEQRLKAFNFYVALSIFANGMIFAALEKANHPAVLVLLGGFVCLLALVFAVVDARSRHLLHLTKVGLKALEADLPEHARLFLLDNPDITQELTDKIIAHHSENPGAFVAAAGDE